ncbi:amidase [Microbacterium halotolerans]|uniref:amidase n=1 Tax=Microbacterium halotolerans TaxID=246613 RepID=UPI001F095C25|nr:amidase family protein [Microbacterium halotolerans]
MISRIAYESELTWLSTRELAARIADGEVSAREALADHFARMDSVNPALNAIVTRDDERALDRADRADARRAAREQLGALHGVPMTHKESTDVAGLPTTRGSALLLDNVAEKDALVIARMRSAGIVTSGKSNVPEFTAGSHTFNRVFGTTLNPFDTTRSAGGSSGGAAAAIAAGIQASGDGSDMGGSLRTPGSFNNLVGMRPTNGRIPHTLPANPWEWLAQPGFMARTVSDVALMMSVASGPAAGAPLSVAEPGSVFDRAEFAHPDRHDAGAGLAGLRIGFSSDLNGLFPIDPDVDAVVRATADVFAGAGARVDDDIPDLRDADEVFHVTRAYDFAADYRTLVREHRDEVKDAVVWNTEMGLALTVDELLSADEARSRLAATIGAYFATHDLLVLTSAQVAPFDARIEYPRAAGGAPLGDYLEWMRAATIISATGCPAVSVPAGFTAGGLPVGVQLVAAPGRDVELLLAAQAFEELTGHHRRHPVL